MQTINKDTVKKDTWVIGNWKSNPNSLQSAKQLATEIKSAITNSQSLTKQQALAEQIQQIGRQNHLMIIPTALHLSAINELTQDSAIALGCQDISFTSATTGAYTGDCSAQQMADIGVQWTLVGHSERREYHQESNEQQIAKIQHAFEQGLGVILCIGESLLSYDNEETLSVLQEQLSILQSIDNLSHYADKLIIAYEPIWAIGTGKVPSVAEVETVHQAIYQFLCTLDEGLAQTAIIYGGSVNPENAQGFASSEWINGALIGGASLFADKFLTIADQFFSTKS